MRITELARVSGGTVDEVRYMERKGFIVAGRKRLKQREVREYEDGSVRKARLIIKYRRRGFTWEAAFTKAMADVQNPRLIDDE